MLAAQAMKEARLDQTDQAGHRCQMAMAYFITANTGLKGHTTTKLARRLRSDQIQGHRSLDKECRQTKTLERLAQRHDLTSTQIIIHLML